MRKFPALTALAAAITPIPAQAATGLYYWTLGGAPEGKRSWIVHFGVTADSTDDKNGWIIQKVDTVVKMNGKLYRIKTFWEAFRVERGYALDHDTFSRVNAEVKYMATHAEARYYPAIELPDCFKKLGKDGNSGDAPICLTDPKLPLDTAPVIRDFKATY